MLRPEQKPGYKHVLVLRRIDQRDLHVFDPHNLNFYIAVHVLINNLLRRTR